MEISIESLQKTYAEKSDEELIRIATQDAQGLRPEVFGIIESELKKRNLSLDILKGALAQNKEYTINEIAHYAEYLRELPCPVCNQVTEKLNGTIGYTVKSFLIFTSYSQQIAVACPECLDKRNNRDIISTALLGWWGIPWGILKTPLYIYRNIKAKHQSKLEYPNNALLSFTLANIGRIETYKEDKHQLKQIIKPK